MALLLGSFVLATESAFPGQAATPSAASAAPAAAAACAGCHGARGEGLGTFPRLAGSGAPYLRDQLEAFASGRRKNAVMQPIAQALPAEQRGELAAFYAAQPLPGTYTDIEPKRASEAGAWLATRGRWDDDLPACAQCHGPGGIGVGANFPPLAGQPAAYLVQQLQAWRTGIRPAGPLGLMQIVARKLSDADIRAVSDYYSQLPVLAAGTQARADGKGVR